MNRTDPLHAKTLKLSGGNVNEPLQNVATLAKFLGKTISSACNSHAKEVALSFHTGQ